MRLADCLGDMMAGAAEIAACDAGRIQAMGAASTAPP